MRQIQLVPIKSAFPRALTLCEGQNLIGRDADCDVRIDDPSISKRHCRLDCNGNHFVIRDLGSTNGTFVNNEPVKRTSFDPGDVLRIGKFKFRLEGFSLDTDPSPAALVAQAETARQTTIAKPGTEQPAVTSNTPVTRQRSAEAAGADHPSVEGKLTPEESHSTQLVAAAPTGTQPDLYQQISSGSAPRPPASAPFEPPRASPTARVSKSRSPRDWSPVKEFLTESLKAAVTLCVCLLLAVWLLVPWSRLLAPSDIALCEFYELALADVISLRDANASAAAWDELSSRGLPQNTVYVQRLEGGHVSAAARLLLPAGRDYLPAMLTESRQQHSTPETLLRKNLFGARTIVGGESLSDSFDSPEVLAKREVDQQAAAAAMGDMFTTEANSVD
jgi:hypothetical protein